MNVCAFQLFIRHKFLYDAYDYHKFITKVVLNILNEIFTFILLENTTIC